MKDDSRPFKTIQDHSRPFKTIQDHSLKKNRNIEFNRRLRRFLFLLLTCFLLFSKNNIEAQYLHEVQSTYEVYNKFSIPDNYSIDSLTDLEIIRMIPKHHIVDETFCIGFDSTSTTTKEYSWLLSGTPTKLYDKVMVDENGTTLYKNGEFVYFAETGESGNSIFHYSGERITMLGYEHPIKWFPQELIDSIINHGYSVTALYTGGDSVFIINNDTISIRYDVSNQYILWKHFNTQGQLTSARYKAVHKLNDSIAVPKADYRVNVTFTNKGIPLQETMYKVYINYIINGVSYLQNNQYLQYTPKPTSEEKKSISIVQQVKRKNNSIQIYPNPVHDKLSIHIPEKLKGKYILVIRDISGSIVRHQEFRYRPSFSIGMSSISPGVYFLYLQSDTVNFTQQIIIH